MSGTSWLVSFVKGQDHLERGADSAISSRGFPSQARSQQVQIKRKLWIVSRSREQPAKLAASLFEPRRNVAYSPIADIEPRHSFQFDPFVSANGPRIFNALISIAVRERKNAPPMRRRVTYFKARMRLASAYLISITEPSGA